MREAVFDVIRALRILRDEVTFTGLGGSPTERSRSFELLLRNAEAALLREPASLAHSHGFCSCAFGTSCEVILAGLGKQDMAPQYIHVRHPVPCPAPEEHDGGPCDHYVIEPIRTPTNPTADPSDPATDRPDGSVGVDRSIYPESVGRPETGQKVEPPAVQPQADPHLSPALSGTEPHREGGQGEGCLESGHPSDAHDVSRRAKAGHSGGAEALERTIAEVSANLDAVIEGLRRQGADRPDSGQWSLGGRTIPPVPECRECPKVRADNERLRQENARLRAACVLASERVRMVW